MSVEDGTKVSGALVTGTMDVSMTQLSVGIGVTAVSVICVAQETGEVSADLVMGLRLESVEDVGMTCRVLEVSWLDVAEASQDVAAVTVLDPSSHGSVGVVVVSIDEWVATPFPRELDVMEMVWLVVLLEPLLVNVTPEENADETAVLLTSETDILLTALVENADALLEPVSCSSSQGVVLCVTPDDVLADHIAVEFRSVLEPAAVDLS